MSPRVPKDAKIKGGYKFLFYSNEGEGVAREAPHIHVRRGRNQAKFWLDPFVELSQVKGFKDHEIAEIAGLLKSIEIKSLMNGENISEIKVSDQDIGYRDIDEPVNAEVIGDSLVVTLKDGRVISTPLAWYPRLLQATPEQLAEVELGAWGLHWYELDEDLSIRGMLLGKPVPTT